MKADVTNPLPTLGDSAKGYAANAFRLWNEERAVPGYHLISTRLKDAEGQSKFFDGISLAPGGAARREQCVLTEKDLEAQAELQKAHEKKRNVQVVIDGNAGAIANPEQALSQIGEAIKDLPPMDAGKALYTAATSYVRSGQWGMAREAYLLLINKYPTHPLSLEAGRWLVRFHASSEARRRQELGQFVELTDMQFDLKDREDPRRVIPKSKGKGVLPKETEIIQATQRSTARRLVSARKWYEGALQMESPECLRRSLRSRCAVESLV